ncbi:MAG: histidine phosphatase family protein [Patescibacteria group bacterium]
MELKNKYFLLRHGQTIYQKEGRKVNYEADSPFKLEITEEGREMIKKSTEILKKTCAEQGQSIDLIFASPFLRAKQSAEIVSKVLGIKKINYDECLGDINLGEFMGKPMEESSKFYLEGKNKFENRPKGGESWADILKRTKSFLDDVEKKYQGKNILVISHADPIWLMAGVLKGFVKDEQFLNSRRSEDKKDLYPKVGELIKI